MILTPRLCFIPFAIVSHFDLLTFNCSAAITMYSNVVCYIVFFFSFVLCFMFWIWCMQQTIVGWFDCWLHLVLFVLWWCIVWWRKAILWCQNKLIMQVAELGMNLSLTSVAYNMSKIFWISWAGSASSASWQLREENNEVISLNSQYNG